MSFDSKSNRGHLVTLIATVSHKAHGFLCCFLLYMPRLFVWSMHPYQVIFTGVVPYRTVQYRTGQVQVLVLMFLAGSIKMGLETAHYPIRSSRQPRNSKWVWWSRTPHTTHTLVLVSYHISTIYTLKKAQQYLILVNTQWIFKVYF